MAQPDRIFLTSSAVVALNGQKVANATTHSYSIRTNSGKTPTNDGLVISKGFLMGDVTVATLETVDGQQNFMIDQLFDGDVVTVTFTHGGRTVVITGTYDEASKNSVVERGSTEGSYKISGQAKRL
jgi:hypothetical protein